MIDSISVVPGDLTALTDASLLARIGADVCLHLAWYAEPARYLHAVPENLASLRASLDLVEALSQSDCGRLVIAGSCAEYGHASADHAVDESAPLLPSTPYARAKAALWLATQDTAHAAGMDLAWARLFFLYGPWEHPDRVVPAAIRACLSHRPFPATSGAQVRDYLHVGDAAAALWAIAISELTGPVNVCSGAATTLHSVLRLVEGAAKAPGTIRFGEKPYTLGEWMWMCGDNSRLRSCGWQPAFTTAEGIADTVRWWREQDPKAASQG